MVTGRACPRILQPAGLVLAVWLLALAGIYAVHGRRVEIYHDSQGGSGGALKEAFSDPTVTTIVIMEDLVLRLDDWEDHSNITLDRNITVTSYNDRMIDFNFTQESVVLGEGVSFTFENISVSNIRRGSGLGVDFFAPLQGSLVIMKNVYRLRAACSPAQQALQNSRSYPRPGNRQQKLEIIPHLVYRGHTYLDNLHLLDFATEIVPDPEVEAHDQQYTVIQVNVTRLCAEFVLSECIRDYGDDLCIQQRLDEIFHHRNEEPTSVRMRNVAIAVPVVAGVLLIGLLVVGLWWKKRSPRQNSSPMGPLKDSSHSDRAASMIQNDQMGREELKRSGPLEDIVLGNHHRSCWQVVAYSKALGMASDFLKDRISLGVLLGAGSFGRVYQGRWQDRDVAIKVLQHDGNTAAAVANEVDLMMSFKHPNVVKAYHFITWALASKQGSPEQSQTNWQGRKSSPQTTFQANAAALGSSSPAAAAAGGSRMGSSPRGEGGELESVVVGHSSNQPLPAALGEHPELERPEQVCRLGDEFVPVMAAHLHLQHEEQRHRQQIEEQQLAAGPGGPQGQESMKLASQGHVAHDLSDLTTPNYLEHVPAVSSDSNNRSGPNGRGKPQGPSEAQTWLILEYCDGGTLLDMVTDGQMHEATGEPCMSKLLVRLRDVAAGMQYLHARNVLHGDLKSLNVLITSNGQAPYGKVAKVSDFGLSRSLKCGQTHRSTRTFGTVNHMSPELLRLGKMSPAGDVYAFGIMMWEVYMRKQAFGGCHYGEVFEKVALRLERPPVPEKMLQEYKLLMTSCWNVDPVLRPGFDSVVKCLQMMLDHCEHTQLAANAGKEGVGDSPFVGDF